MMHQITEQIRELQDLRGILPEFELADRARRLLDRAEMRPINLADYLAEKGYSGYRLAAAVGTFGKVVKATYADRHGVAPTKTHVIVNGDVRPICAYLEADRELIDSAYEEWLR